MRPGRRRGAIATEIRETRSLPATVGTLTARDAHALAVAIAQEHDRAARLALIVSGEDIGTDGRSHTWEVFFDLPDRRARVVVEIRCPIEGLSAADDTGRIEIRITPFVPAGGMMERLLREGRVTPRFIDDQWDDELRRHPPLPVPFKDSPTAVAELAGQGVDWLSGSTSLNLGSRTLDDGSAVWETSDHGDTWRTSFA